MQSNSDTQYCIICGSIDIVDANPSLGQEKNKEFRPNISVAGQGVSLGSIGSKKNSSLNYTTKYCKECLNIDVAKKSSPEPITIKLKEFDIVIPSSLFEFLYINQINVKDEIVDIISRYLNKMRDFYNCYVKNGVNQCKRSKVGYKLKLKINNHKITCWIIISIINNRLVYRISYGGKNIICP